jgi:hypothetical protein
MSQLGVLIDGFVRKFRPRCQVPIRLDLLAQLHISNSIAQIQPPAAILGSFVTFLTQPVKFRIFVLPIWFPFRTPVGRGFARVTPMPRLAGLGQVARIAVPIPSDDGLHFHNGTKRRMGRIK